MKIELANGLKRRARLKSIAPLPSNQASGTSCGGGWRDVAIASTPPAGAGQLQPSETAPQNRFACSRVELPSGSLHFPFVRLLRLQDCPSPPLIAAPFSCSTQFRWPSTTRIPRKHRRMHMSVETRRNPCVLLHGAGSRDSDPSVRRETKHKRMLP